MKTCVDFSDEVGVTAACKAFGMPRASFYRQRLCRLPRKRNKLRSRHPRALRRAEREKVLEMMHSEEFVDLAPAQIWAKLLEEGRYLCSPRTMYRILKANGEVKERRNQARRPKYKKPELLAEKPNQVWSWDITKLKGPAKWSYFYLYVIIDIYSRYVVGWLIADRESSVLAKQLIAESYRRQKVQPDELTLHSDRGASMTSKSVALLLADLGATKSHSRPYVSNDNPFSEAQFKTLKYRPDFPSRFGCIEDAKTFCRTFFAWYNNEHRHSGLNLFAPSVSIMEMLR